MHPFYASLLYRSRRGAETVPDAHERDKLLHQVVRELGAAIGSQHLWNRARTKYAARKRAPNLAGTQIQHRFQQHAMT